MSYRTANSKTNSEWVWFGKVLSDFFSLAVLNTNIRFEELKRRNKNVSIKMLIYTCHKIDWFERNPYVSPFLIPHPSYPSHPSPFASWIHVQEYVIRLCEKLCFHHEVLRWCGMEVNWSCAINILLWHNLREKKIGVPAI